MVVVAFKLYALLVRTNQSIVMERCGNFSPRILLLAILFVVFVQFSDATAPSKFQFFSLKI